MPNQQSRYVADLMTIDPVVIRVDAPIEQAEDAIRAYRVSGLPVVDEDARLVGVISQTDLLGMDRPVSAVLRGRSHLRVGDLMTSPAVTVDMMETLREAARRMRRERVHRLVAVDSGNQPVGVLSATDYVDLYADEGGDPG